MHGVGIDKESIKNACVPHKSLHMDVYSSFTPNCQNSEACPSVGEQTAVCSDNGILLC